MADFNMPIIELKLRYMSEQIHHAFIMHQNELSEHIKKSIDALMTDANIQKEIDKLCYDCMQECIKEVFNSDEVKRDLVKIMTEQILARLNKTEPVSFSGSVSSTTLTGTGAPLPVHPSIISSTEEDNFWEPTAPKVVDTPTDTGAPPNVFLENLIKMAMPTTYPPDMPVPDDMWDDEGDKNAEG